MEYNVKKALAQRDSKTSNTVLKDMAELFGLSVKENDLTELPIDRLQTYVNHPFRVEDHVDFETFVLDIQQNGVFQPIIVRPAKKERFYEILAGHKRTAAVKRCGKSVIKAVIIQADDELASRSVLKTNFSSRVKFYPSEIAKSYKLRHDELKRQRQENSTRWNSDELIDKQLEEEFAISKSKLYMYLRFNYLIDELLSMLDLRKLSAKTAVELSYLPPQEQLLVYQKVYVEKCCKLDKKHAALLRQQCMEGEWTAEKITRILTSILPEMDSKQTDWYPKFQKYQSKFHSREEMERVIEEFLDSYEGKGVG